jgi:nucleotide-binding universal stress UspA family protein
MKALWALEPFHQDSTRIQGMYHLLTQLVGQSSNIEVGFIVTRTESDLHWAFNVPQKDRFTVYPRKILKTALRNAKCSIDDNKIHVVDYETMSKKKAVDRLLSLAETRGTNLIALYTHARQGFMRLALGSFAETVIHRSKKSLLLMNPKTKCSPKIKNILFSSDFSWASEKHLKKAIEICKQINAKLTIFHQAQVTYKWSLDDSNRSIQDYRRKVNRMKSRIEQECKIAEVPYEVIIVSEFSPTTDLILKTATKVKADLIVIAAKVGPVAALMGGSTTRQIIREGTRPILVLK